MLVSAAASNPHLPMQTLPCNQASDEPTMHAQAITQQIKPNTLVRNLCSVDKTMDDMMMQLKTTANQSMVEYTGQGSKACWGAPAKLLLCLLASFSLWCASLLRTGLRAAASGPA